MDTPGAFALNLSCPCCFKPGIRLCDDPSMTATNKLAAIRISLAENDLDAYIILSEDNHASEYVSPCDERRSYLTGFSGSAGVVLVTTTDCFLYTDSRYYLQAAQQLPDNVTLKKMEPNLPTLEEDVFALLKNKRVGVDPFIFPHTRAEQWASDWKKSSDLLRRTDPTNDSLLPPTLVPILANLVDEIWPSRPPIPCSPILLHPLSLAGETTESKLTRVRSELKESKSDVLIVTALDQIGWLFNLRGGDIDCNPVFFSYAVVTQDACHLFLHRGKAAVQTNFPDVKKHLSKADVTLHPYGKFTPEFLAELLPSKAFVLVEKGTCSMSIAAAIVTASCTLVETEDMSPINHMKSIKNSAEIEGIKSSALRDSAAVCQFFAWLEEKLVAGEVWSESKLSDELEKFRAAQKDFVGVSFDTISSVGPNSAVIHYKPEAGSDQELKLSRDDIYLLDSGGQYLDGTTDVTRTTCFGTTTAEQRRYYTRVLQGHINLGRAVFPEGTCGLVLDGLARAPLWADGLDYGHGTGHGIGAYMNVHEGPFGISGASRPGNLVRKNPRALQVLLEPIKEGMYMSNEPGFYLDGHYGFRIESDIVTVKSGLSKEGERAYLEFDCVTKVPMSKSLTEVSLLNSTEKKWLNEYHQDCLESVKGLLQEAGDSRALAWLERECEEFV